MKDDLTFHDGPKYFPVFFGCFSQLGNYQSGILKKPTNLESYDRLTRKNKNKNKKDQVRAAV